MKRILLLVFIAITFVSCGGSSSSTDELVDTETSNDEEVIVLTSKESLGESLFLDNNLSLTRTMSCATCHNPEHAFIDNRVNTLNAAVSLGDDGASLGDRNTPTASYAHLIPEFDANNRSGGQFLDGRASTLTDQAKLPFLNIKEMMMPDKLSVVARILENTNYVASFKSIYGETIFDDTDTSYDAIADAIASFESQSAIFSPFDSDFDANNLSAQERRGRQLFRQNDCARCHSDTGNNPLFTDFEYSNLGIPINTAVRAANGQGLDHGLLANPLINNNNQDGKFRTPTLRNVAVTAPYMHNGVFQTLDAVVHFYNTRDVGGAINPETNSTWEAAEINNNIEQTNNIGNLGLSVQEEEDIVEFLKTLTDNKFKSLIP